VLAERSRLARELHESVSQSLYGIVLGTRTALEQIDDAPEAARTALHYSVDLAHSTLAEMRSLIFSMRPNSADHPVLH
jgi:signal transduction histidine kinase